MMTTSSRRSAGNNSNQSLNSPGGGSMNNDSPNNTNPRFHQHQPLSNNNHDFSQSGPVKTFNISIIGLSGGGKGSSGVGKSCLANRFVRQLEDEFSTDHISTLSNADFSGSPVINNDHWLYWGQRSLFVPVSSSEPSSPNPHQEWRFRVVEQTEFVDDESFQVLKGTGPYQKDSYVKRATGAKLQSPDKLMYICKDQLGLETEYPQQSLQPEGKFYVDGFICLFDVSHVDNRPIHEQTEVLCSALNEINKSSKKPVVIVATKCDQATAEGLRELDKLLTRREARNATIIPLIETSAHQNVNVEAPFIALAHLIAKPKNILRTKIVPFKDAQKARLEALEFGRRAYWNKLKMCVKDYRISWSALLQHIQTDNDFVHFTELFGMEAAERLFRTVQSEARDNYMKERLRSQAQRLPPILSALLPKDLSLLSVRSWRDVADCIQDHPQFEHYFQPVGALVDETDNSGDTRLSPELLYNSQEAEMVFRNYINNMEAAAAQNKMGIEFEALLKDCSAVTPGKPLSDIRIFLMGKEAFEVLPDSMAQEIYDKYQMDLIRKARCDFVELLLENVDLFTSPILFPTNSSSDLPPGLSENDLENIHDKLQQDPRYRQLNGLFEARENMMCQYASFVSFPLSHHCPAAQHCSQILIRHMLASTPIIKQEENQVTSQLNLVILGEPSLPSILVNEIRRYLPSDTYSNSQKTFSLDYRCIEGDVRLAQNSLLHPEFPPDVLIGVFSCRRSLEFIRDNLAHAMLMSATNSVQNPHGANPLLTGEIAMVLMLGVDERETDDYAILFEQGMKLSDSLRCSFIGPSPTTIASPHLHSPSIPPSSFSAHNNFNYGGDHHLNNNNNTKKQYQESVKSETGKIFGAAESSSSTALFSRPQISSLMDMVSSNCAGTPKLLVVNRSLRLMLCVMCGDDYSLPAVLAPLLQRQICPPSVSNKNDELSPESDVCTIKIQSGLGDKGMKVNVELDLVSYHTGLLSQQQNGRKKRYDGYILVYSLTRPASLAHLRTLGAVLPESWPIQILGVGEVTEFFRDASAQNLLTLGNGIADSLDGGFETVSPEGRGDGVVYSRFIQQVYNHPVLPPPPPSRLPPPTPLQLQQQQQPQQQLLVSQEGDYAALSEFQSGHWSGGSRRMMGQEAGDSTSSSPPHQQQPSHHQNFANSDEHQSRRNASESSIELCPPFKNRDSYRRAMSPHQPCSGGESSSTSHSYSPRLFRRLDDNESRSGTEYVAPLATPEDSIDVTVGVGDMDLYRTVKDALGTGQHHAYAPIGSLSSTTSQQQHQPNNSSQQQQQQQQPGRTSPYEKVGRKPTPRKGSNKSRASPRGVVDVDNTNRPSSSSALANNPVSIIHEPSDSGSKISLTNNQPESGVPPSQATRTAGLQQHQQHQRTSPGLTQQVHRHFRRPFLPPPTTLSIFRSASEESLLFYGHHHHHLLRHSINNNNNNSKNDDNNPASTAYKQFFPSTDGVTTAEDGTMGGLEKVDGTIEFCGNVLPLPSADSPVGAAGPHQRGFVRKVTSSFRFGRKKSGAGGSQSVPQSPSMTRSPPVALPTATPSAFVNNQPTSTSTINPAYYPEPASSTHLSVSPYEGVLPSSPNKKASSIHIGNLFPGKTSRKASTGPNKSSDMKAAPGGWNGGSRSGVSGGGGTNQLEKKVAHILVPAGSTLESLAESESDPVPRFIRVCVEHIEQKGGLSFEGIYRVPGNQQQVALIEQKFAENPAAFNLTELDVPINAVATAIKNFLSALPEPLIPNGIFDKIVRALSTGRDEEGKVASISNVLRRLSPSNKAVLAFYCNHLKKVASHAHVNNMDYRNLAKCFWPTLLRPHFESFEMMAQLTPRLEEFAHLLFNHFERLLAD